MAQDDRFDLARLERLERRLQALEDAEAIRYLKARYAALCDANTMPTGSRCCSQRTRCGKAPAWAGLRGARRSEASSEGRRGFFRSQCITASMARSRRKPTRPKRDGT